MDRAACYELRVVGHITLTLDVNSMKLTCLQVNWRRLLKFSFALTCDLIEAVD